MEYAGLDLHKSFCQTKIGTKEGEMLKGIEVKQLRRFADERGFFTEIRRKDWQLLDDEVVQTNFSISYPGIVRAWH